MKYKSFSKPPSIAKDGYYISFVSIAVALVIYHILGPLFAAPLAVFGIFTLWFFRDPERKVPEEDNIIVSAADGVIKSIDEVNETKFLKEPAIRIVTFLSLFNVHINRAPIKGRIEKISYEKGKFYAAHLIKAEKNEKNHVMIANKDISVLVIQMVGAVARRIACWVDVDEHVPKGGKFGLIRFGSRTDVLIPKSKIDRILVKKGDRVKGGETIIAKTVSI
ncbi:MAG: phosphatidylserine decarboxylase [Candidatus Aenigmarchaeota archaeon]|nr:phosphatidylserine decarboxylase [Candidatus Aenigmarchaeota archaeon]MCK5372763.1 phosphatidylserine decarboxylase [Candidatus Aenigmarchaeota archaeon]MCK5451825.1 phosphatidylserine decarboxylase [Candidatus Aenigmarchaeota archaeon]